jgi:hypothetical protein
VWKSETRGDSWTPISGDLTRQEERIKLPIMGGLQSYNNPWDMYAMSYYSSITSLSESPVQKGLLYAGTDDGLIQVSEDDGENWRKFELSSIKGLPERPFVNDVRADLFDENTVYAALDNHKYGDFKPYLIKSTDKGRTWTLMSGDLPDRHLTWRLVQDHVDKDLLFVATEFGIFFTKNSGTNWVQLKGGLPTISFRDLTIQRRENDLVAASFGRSFFILDDITPLRELKESDLQMEAKLYSIKDAYWYSQRSGGGSVGSDQYAADNPPYGAVFTYYLKDALKTKASERKKQEKELAKNNQDIPFPGWETIREEEWQEEPQIVLTIKDSDGNLVNTISGKNSEGLQRVSWDLTRSNKGVIELDDRPGLGGSSYRVTPGTYSVTIHKMVDGVMTPLDGPKAFNVVPLWKKTALPGASHDEIDAFIAELIDFQKEMGTVSLMLDKGMKKVDAMRTAAVRADKQPQDLIPKIHDVKRKLLQIEYEMNGNSNQSLFGGESTMPTPGNRFWTGRRAAYTTYGPTPLHKESLEIGKRQLASLKADLMEVMDQMPELEKSLKAIGAPYIEGSGIAND